MSRNKNDSSGLRVPTSRMARLGRIGSMTAGVAGNMALSGMAELGQGRRPAFRDLLLTPRNITRIADQLARMRGAAMKIGQLVSMDSGDMLPPELTEIMARLRNDAHFMPPAQLKQVLNTEWPAGWLHGFAKFDVHPIAAASIGQVHRAQTKDGRDLAIKVQYPGVADSIDSDVANVGVLLRMSGLIPKGFELAPYLKDARQQLHRETDYMAEATELQRFASLMADDPGFVVPGYHADWSTPRILAMDHIQGLAIETVADLAQQDRDRVATALIDLMLQELFTFGVMQTDPNFANYLYQPDTGRIVLLDFGAAQALNPDTVAEYRRLIAAGLTEDRERLAQAVTGLGLISKDTEPRHRDRMLGMVETCFAALKDGDAMDFANSDLSARMQAEGIALAEDGFVPPPVPVEVLLLQRKFGGTFLLAAKLGAKVDLMTLAKKHLP